VSYLTEKIVTRSTTSAPSRSRGRIFLLCGVSLAALGVLAYVLQVFMQRLIMPWYMPALGVLGVALVGVSLWERRTLWRVLAMSAVVLLAGAELALLYATRLPPYAGPIQVGGPLPAFEAKQADGTPFSQNDMTGLRHHLLVFFRGRW
jgi:hypothetical protein